MFAVPLTLREANAFVLKHHRHHGEARGCICCVACSAEEDPRVCGVAIVRQPDRVAAAGLRQAPRASRGSEDVTHTELVARALRWVRVSLKYPIAIGEGVAACIEQPDVLGFRWLGADTLLVECKASRADFLADAKKPFRQHPSLGMGRQRIYVAPPDMLKPEEIPAGWGLAVPTARGMRMLRKPVAFEERAVRNEIAVLHTLVQRVTDGWGRKVFGEFAPPLVDGDPHPTTASIIREQRAEIRKLRDENRALRDVASPGRGRTP